MTETCEPPDPRVGGWHWVKNREVDYAWYWSCVTRKWSLPVLRSSGGARSSGYRYHSPCPTPEQWAERERVLRALAKLYVDLKALIEDSIGVAGLHKNGDLALWHDLVRGGQFEDWLTSYSLIEESDLGRLALEYAKEAGE